MKQLKNILCRIVTPIIVLVVVVVFSLQQAPAVHAQSACATSPTSSVTDTTSVYIAQSGTYSIWSQMLAPASSNNTYYLKIDGGCAFNVGGGSAIPANAWTWVNYQNGVTTSPITMSLTAGTHSVELIQNASGVGVGRILFDLSSSCFPTGTGDNCVVSQSPTATVAPIATAVPIQPTGTSTTTLSIYIDALATGWLNWTSTSKSTVNLENTSPVYSGNYSIAFTAIQPYGNIFLHNNTAVNTSSYGYIHFMARGAVAGHQYMIKLYGPNGALSNAKVLISNYGGPVSATQWVSYNIPLSVLNAANTNVSSINLAEAQGTAAPTLYVDDLVFSGQPVNGQIGSSGGTNTPTPTTTSTSNTQTYSSTVTAQSSTISNGWNKHWLIAEYAAKELQGTALGATFIKSINNKSTYEIVPHNLRIGQDPLPNAIHVATFPSYQAIKYAFATNEIPSAIKVILYDNEAWSQTPLIEQQHPFTYVPLAEQLVHNHGLLFMNAPAADLKKVLDPSASNNYAGYLQVKLATLAKYTDIFEIQAQNAPGLAAYLSFAKQAVKQARGANSNAVILVGITAKQGGPSSQVLFEEIRDMYNYTDGYWFNIIGSKGPSIALRVIQSLEKQY